MLGPFQTCNFLLAICTTQVQKRVKKGLKIIQKLSYEKFASKGFDPGPSESVGTPLSTGPPR